MTTQNTQLAQVQQAPVSFNFFDAQQFDTMQRISKMFALSELVPDMYKASNSSLEKATANCMIAISLAQRMQADALMVMQQLVIIYGRPSWSSKFLIATVNTCGRFSTLKYKFNNLGKIGKINFTVFVKGQGARTEVFDGTEIDNIECIAYTSEKGSDEVLESSPVSIKMAIEEGWFTKAGSKWKTMPKKMLIYRAASFWTNEYAPEISMGMKTDDEVIDTVDTDFVEVSTKVKDQIENNANKTAFGFDNQPKTENEPAKVGEPENKPNNNPAAGLQPNTSFDNKPADKPGFE